MSIVSGYKKFKKYILTSSGFQLVSHWTNANTLQFDDGKTAQAKLGAIDGISSSKDSSSDKIAASTKLVSELNSNLSAADGEKFRYGKTADGKRGYIITDEAGADTVIPFKGTILSDANIYNQIWASGGNGSHLNVTRYTFNEDYSSAFIVQSSAGIMGYGLEAGITYNGNGTRIPLYSEQRTIGTDSSQTYIVIYIEKPRSGDTLAFGKAIGAQLRSVSIFAFK